MSLALACRSTFVGILSLLAVSLLGGCSQPEEDSAESGGSAVSDDEPNLPTGILVDKKESSSSPLEVRIDKANIWLKRKRPTGENGSVNLHVPCSGAFRSCRPSESPSIAYVSFDVEAKTLVVKFVSDKSDYTGEYYYALTGKKRTGNVAGTTITIALEPKS